MIWKDAGKWRYINREVKKEQRYNREESWEKMAVHRKKRCDGLAVHRVQIEERKQRYDLNEIHRTKDKRGLRLMHAERKKYVNLTEGKNREFPQKTSPQNGSLL